MVFVTDIECTKRDWNYIVKIVTSNKKNFFWFFILVVWGKMAKMVHSSHTIQFTIFSRTEKKITRIITIFSLIGTVGANLGNVLCYLFFLLDILCARLSLTIIKSIFCPLVLCFFLFSYFYCSHFTAHFVDPSAVSLYISCVFINRGWLIKQEKNRKKNPKKA